MAPSQQRGPGEQGHLSESHPSVSQQTPASLGAAGAGRRKQPILPPPQSITEVWAGHGDLVSPAGEWAQRGGLGLEGC